MYIYQVYSYDDDPMARGVLGTFFFRKRAEKLANRLNLTQWECVVKKRKIRFF